MSTDSKATFRSSLGAQGEDFIASQLIKKGYKVLARNFSWRAGEIDIVAQKEELIIFVEVKTRTKETGFLSEVITRSKQQKIIKTAIYFLALHDLAMDDHICRFDVALINGPGQLTYIPNAFTQGDMR